MGMLAYYWVLATPAVGFLFGCYLYIAVNWFHVHYDEAFSALRIPNFKGFSRLHINTNGDLEIYGLAMDKVKPMTFCLRYSPPPPSPPLCMLLLFARQICKLFPQMPCLPTRPQTCVLRCFSLLLSLLPPVN